MRSAHPLLLVCLGVAFAFPAQGAPAGARLVSPLSESSPRAAAAAQGFASTCGVVPSASSCQPPITAGTAPIVMHGDPSDHIVNVYLIWFGYDHTPAAQALAERFVQNIGSTTYFGTLALYGDAEGPASTNIRLGGGQSYFVNAATCPGTNEQNVLDSQIATIVDCSGAPREPLQQSVYLVITAPGIQQGTFCSDYCGWHDAIRLSGTRMAVGFVGEPDLSCTPCLWPAGVVTPNGTVADSLISVLGHEIAEAITDPDVTTGWNIYTSSCGGAGEVADLCVWGVCSGHAHTALGGASYTVQAGSDYFYLQDLWQNADDGGFCSAGATRPSAASISSDTLHTFPNGYVNLTATITGLPGAATPTGSVSFFQGTTQLSAVTLVAGPNTSQGAPTATASLRQTFGQGSYQLSARYAGDTLYASALTSNLSLSVTGRALTISASSTTVSPRGRVALAASGGDGNTYNWSMVTSRSGGSVSSDGLYTAGPTGNVTDAVQVTDSSGNGAQIQIVVGPVLSIVTPSAPVPPQGTATLRTAGGSGGTITWSMFTSASGATVSSAGVYRAGMTGGVTDSVQAVDDLGNIATAPVTVGPALTVPATAVPPRGNAQLVATGGSGTGLKWQMFHSASGGSVTLNGQFTAGALPNVQDLVQVTDSLGNIGRGTISIGSGIVVHASAVEVAPHGRTTLHPSGGSGGGYQFSLLENGSGGTLSVDGNYFAGGVGNTTDLIDCVDSLLNHTLLSIHVGPGVSITGIQPFIPGDPTGLQMTATGGTGRDYVWTAVEMPSGGTITPSGHYHPGHNGDTHDVVAATDPVGNSATITTVVGPSVTIASPGIVPPGQTVTLSAAGGNRDFVWKPLSFESHGTLSNMAETPDAGPAMDAGSEMTDAGSTEDGGESGMDAGDADAGVDAGTPVTPGDPTLRGIQMKYKAGTRPNSTDRLSVVDSFGNSASLAISVGPGISITSSDATVKAAPAAGGFLSKATAGEKQRYRASGGLGHDYTFTLSASNNKSGGSITADGNYTAGQTAGKDTIAISDPLGNTATLTVDVSAGTTAGKPSGGGDSGGCGCRGSGDLTAGALLVALAMASRRRRLARA